jgi:hypothetical protein
MFNAKVRGHRAFGAVHLFSLGNPPRQPLTGSAAPPPQQAGKLQPVRYLRWSTAAGLLTYG